MIFEVALLLVSLIVLAKSSDIVTDKAVILSQYFRVSQMAIGFLLIAGATSLPELSVSVIASVMGQGAISAGNVFGSNIADVFLVLGACAFLYRLRLKKQDAVEIGGVVLVTTIITLYFIYSAFVLGSPVIARWEGIVLLLAFAGYIFYVLREKEFPKDGAVTVTKREALNAFVIFFAGIGLVLVSSGIAVDSAVRISDLFGISRTFLGATIVAIGTSLPELSVELAAVRKRQYALAVGDAIGSTITNITLVLGVAAALGPIFILAPASLLTVLIFAILANVILLYLVLTRKKIGRLTGILFILLYLLFLFVLSGAEAAGAAPLP